MDSLKMHCLIFRVIFMKTTKHSIINKTVYIFVPVGGKMLCWIMYIVGQVHQLFYSIIMLSGNTINHKNDYEEDFVLEKNLCFHMRKY